MSDNPTTPSGSRWEPDPEVASDEAATTESPAAVPTGPTDYSYGQTPVTPDTDEPGPARANARGRAIMAGAAAALALGGGVVGFVVGHNTAGGDDVAFRPAGFNGQGPGGEGQQGPPSFRDHDDDGDGGGFGQPPQDSDGQDSSSGTTGGSTPQSGSGTTGTGT